MPRGVGGMLEHVRQDALFEAHKPGSSLSRRGFNGIYRQHRWGPLTTQARRQIHLLQRQCRKVAPFSMHGGMPD